MSEYLIIVELYQKYLCCFCKKTKQKKNLFIVEAELDYNDKDSDKF